MSWSIGQTNWTFIHVLNIIRLILKPTTSINYKDIKSIKLKLLLINSVLVDELDEYADEIINENYRIPKRRPADAHARKPKFIFVHFS